MNIAFANCEFYMGHGFKQCFDYSKGSFFIGNGYKVLVKELIRRGHNFFWLDKSGLRRKEKEKYKREFSNRLFFLEQSPFKINMRKLQAVNIDVLIARLGRSIGTGNNKVYLGYFYLFKLLKLFLDRKTKILLWDTDNRLNTDSTLRRSVEPLLENGLVHLLVQYETVIYENQHTFYPPIDISLRIPSRRDPDKLLVFTGYYKTDRMDKFREVIGKASKKKRGIYVYGGNWPIEIKREYPNIQWFNPVNYLELMGIQNSSLCCISMVQKSYERIGHYVGRIGEIALSSSIIISDGNIRGIDKFVEPRFLIGGRNSIISILEKIEKLTFEDRVRIHNEQLNRLSFLRPDMQVDNLLSIIKGMSKNRLSFPCRYQIPIRDKLQLMAKSLAIIIRNDVRYKIAKILRK